MATHTSQRPVSRLTAGQLRLYEQLEIHDPEGHGGDLNLTRTKIVFIPLFALFFTLASFLTLWAVSGLTAAFTMIVLFFLVFLISASPVWGAAILREREHAALMNRAELSDLLSQIMDAEAELREESEGGPPTGRIDRREDLIRRVRELASKISA